MLVLRSASVIGGMPITGRIVALRTARRPTGRRPESAGHLPSEFRSARWWRSRRARCRRLEILVDPVAHLGGDEDRPDLLRRRADIGVIARPTASRGSPLEKSTPAIRGSRATPAPPISPCTSSMRLRARSRLARSRILLSTTRLRVARAVAQHHRTAGDGDAPGLARLRRRLEPAEQRDPVRTRHGSGTASSGCAGWRPSRA